MEMWAQRIAMFMSPITGATRCSPVFQEQARKRNSPSAVYRGRA